MSKYSRYQYQMNTISALVMSPREQCGIYLKEESAIDKIKIIYPFYQYGEYEEYHPEKAQFYIPGSSIKGAIGSSRIMVDDILIEKDKIELRNMYKIPYIPQAGEPMDSSRKLKAEVFFPMVGVEMLKAGQWMEGELYADGDIIEIMSAMHEKSKKKLEQWSKRLSAYVKDVTTDEGAASQITLDTVWQKVNEVYYLLEKRQKNEYLVIMGGYKGSFLSHIFEKDEVRNAVYVDMQTQLPHGLAKIVIQN